MTTIAPIAPDPHVGESRGTHPVIIIQPGTQIGTKSQIIVDGDGTITVTLTPLRASHDALRSEFARLADQWHQETDFFASPTRRIAHPKYLKIIGLGRHILPLILEDLERRGGDWYVALEAMLSEHEQSPVPPDATGDFRRIRQAWLQWGRDHEWI